LSKKDELSDEIQFLIDSYTFETGFYLQFKSFVPRSMMLRFIANNGALSNEETYWRNGIIYKSPDTQSRIHVEYDHEKSNFTIAVQNRAQQIVDMQNIVAQFVKLNDSEDNIQMSNDGKNYADLRTIRNLQQGNRRGDIYTEGSVISLNDYNWLIEKPKTEELSAFEKAKNQIKDFISKGNISDALDALSHHATKTKNERLQQDTILLKSRITNINKQKDLGLLAYKDADIEMTRLGESILNMF
jgi:Effector-associated domain 11